MNVVPIKRREAFFINVVRESVKFKYLVDVQLDAIKFEVVRVERYLVTRAEHADDDIILCRVSIIDFNLELVLVLIKP